MKMSRYLGMFLLAAGVGLLPGRASGQTQSAITGQVRDRTSQQPLAEAQVFVVGTQRGARTDAQGQFRIPTLHPEPISLGPYALGTSRRRYR